MAKAQAIRDAEAMLRVWDSPTRSATVKVNTLCANAPAILRDLIKLHARKSAKRRVRRG